MNEVYEKLASAIIGQSIKDYVDSFIKIKHLEEKLDKLTNEPQEPLVRKKGETSNAFKCRTYRHTPNYVSRCLDEEKEKLESCRKFLTGDWIKRISNLDGNALMEECNRKLKEKGYTV